MEEQKCRAASRSSIGRTCSEHPCDYRLHRSFRDLPWVAACCALSLLSLGVCIFVYLKTSELQHRLLNLENDRDSRSSAWFSADQVEPKIIDRLDQILEEKLAARFPRVREARDAPQSCICPPGSPGSRGKRGRIGDPGPPTSALLVSMLGSSQYNLPEGLARMQLFDPFCASQKVWSGWDKEPKTPGQQAVCCF
ncbi:collagen alpha-1(XXV) chain-like [Brienomyrus brachyistius]|uniref:collagen alpha-1(XXV) chain-like n=1 Tax=Brienomyrus brachyistius TaxID=42636 RepID=UPI0020B44559|nr:collagen alpha-1(XXV) chain-like [Brienomyrus brachyistius]